MQWCAWKDQLQQRDAFRQLCVQGKHLGQTWEADPKIHLFYPAVGFFSLFFFGIVSLQCCVSFCWTTKWISYVVQLLSHVQLFASPWTAACQASWSLVKLLSVESVMPSNHLILCHPLLLPPSVSLSIRVFSNELALHIRWPNYWSFSLSISPSSEYSGLISFRID